MTIKNTVYKIAKNIAKKQQMDIEPEELSALALHKIYNLPYFKDSNQYLILFKNVFDEINMGVHELNQVKGYTNGNIDRAIVKFNIKETIPEEFNKEDKIHNRKEVEIIKNMKSILLKSETMEELKKNIENYEKSSDPLFLSKLFLMIVDNRRSTLRMIKAMDYFVKYEIEDKNIELSFENIHKKRLYRGSGVSDLTDGIFSYHANDYINNSQKYNQENEDYSLPSNSLKELTGLNNITMDDLKTFRKDYPDEYADSIYKMIVENKPKNLIIEKIYNEKYFKEDKKILLNKLNKELEKETIEDLQEKYNKEINYIVDKICQKEPVLKNDINNTKNYIQKIEYKRENYFEVIENFRKENKSKLELFENDYGYSDYEYDIIKGLHFYKREYAFSGIVHILKNDLEDFAAIEGRIENTTRVSYDDKKIPSVKISYYYDANRGTNDEMKKQLVESFIKYCNDERPIFSYDIYDRLHRNSSDFNDSFINIINDLKEEYPNIVFINDGTKYDTDSSFMKDLKDEMLTYFIENSLTNKQLIEANKNLEKFFKTPKFIDMSKKDYFERKKENDVSKVMAEIFKENNNKLKVKI